MRRRAILIGNNTGKDAPNFLKGVDKDLINYRNYLLSSIGGEWSEDEVRILHNRGRADILQTIKNCRLYADYTFVVFSGHGFVNSRNMLTYICVSDGYITEDELDTRLIKQSLILDCCREESLLESFIGDTGESFEKGEPSAISGVRRRLINARAKFDNALIASSDGHFTGYACKTDQLSGDNPTLGGVFSSALIRAGKEFGSRDSYKYKWMAMLAAVNRATAKVSADPFSDQEPTYFMYPSEMKLTAPFAVTNLIKNPNLW